MPDLDHDARSTPGPASRAPAANPAIVPPPPPRDPFHTYMICAVCLGNICRSPMAEVLIRDEIEKAGIADRVIVESAGTGDWHIGDQMDRRARAELNRRGHDGDGHRARQIDGGWLEKFDLLLAMDGSNLRSLEKMARGRPGLAGRIRMFRSFDPAAPAAAQVPDPYGGGPADFADVYDLIQTAARGLAAQLAQMLPAPDRG